METAIDAGVKPKRRGRPFSKGNPGRPVGSRNKTTVALEQLLEGQAEAIVAKVLEKALAGDGIAMRLVFERVMGARRERSLTDLDLPPIRSAADCTKASAAILAAVGSGKITPGEGVAVMQIVEAAIRAFETSELEERLSALEGATKGDAP